MQRITFNSIVLPSSASHLLAFRILKSYLDHKKLTRDFDVLLDLHLTDTPDERIARDIIEREPQIAAFSVYPWNVSKVESVCSLIKASGKDVFIVLGGPYATYTAERMMEAAPVDVIVKGPGEDVLCRVLELYLEGARDFGSVENLIYRKNGNPVETKTDYSFDVSRQQYALSVTEGDYPIFYYETSRGCPFRCRYCTWNASMGKVLYYPKEKVEKDLEAIFGLPHVKYLGLCDADMFFDKQHGLWVLGKIRELNSARRKGGLPPVNMMFEINPQFLDEECIDEILMLPDGPNIISCGLQTEDEDVNRKHLNRPFNRKKYTKNLNRLFEKAGEKHLLERVKKSITLEIIYGLPGDSLEGFKKTLDYLLSELDATNFICFRFEVLPGSYFWDRSDGYDLTFEDRPPHYLISSDTFSAQDMEAAEKLVFFMYLFSTIFKGIMRFVEKKIPHGRFAVYEKIIEHMTREFPGFFSDLYERYRHEDENETLLNMVKYQKERENSAIRYRIIQEAREIVKSFAADEGATGNGRSSIL